MVDGQCALVSEYQVRVCNDTRIYTIPYERCLSYSQSIRGSCSYRTAAKSNLHLGNSGSPRPNPGDPAAGNMSSSNLAWYPNKITSLVVESVVY
jgi:hypothetical protein